MHICLCWKQCRQRPERHLRELFADNGKKGADEPRQGLFGVPKIRSVIIEKNKRKVANDYLTQTYSIADVRMELDKDILVKGNKIYSPDTCVFTPQRINTLIVGANRIRGKFPIGVYYNKQKKRYIASLSCGNKTIKVARCKTPIEAFYEYKFYKEQHIKNVAEEYRKVIPERLYNALMNWNIEITD